MNAVTEANVTSTNNVVTFLPIRDMSAHVWQVIRWSTTSAHCPTARSNPLSVTRMLNASLTSRKEIIVAPAKRDITEMEFISA